ncbi:unnamed protein product [Hymenolepis diminuta]|uniref:Uncharacterized protein n=1 Tax=Hymenolepis diminuta TaxID=6216 RepID=A0A564Y8E4_HYMDI|nr:unnamed protein product [Hymenolepis diminuta]
MSHLSSISYAPVINFQLSNAHLSNPTLGLLNSGKASFFYPIRKIISSMEGCRVYLDLAPKVALPGISAPLLASTPPLGHNLIQQNWCDKQDCKPVRGVHPE